MELIGTTLGRNVHVGTGSRAELRRSDICLDLELLNRVYRGLDCLEFEKMFVVTHPIESKVVHLTAVARDGGAATTNNEKSSGVIPLNCSWYQ